VKGAAALVLSIVLLAAPPVVALEIHLVQPTSRDIAIGPTTVIVIVSSDSPQVRVELRLDGEKVDERNQAPYEFTVTVGDDLGAHRFTAVATDASGARAQAQVTTLAVSPNARIDVGLQQLYVTATGSHGVRRTDLGRDDFVVKDEGQLQEIVTFANGDIPFTAVLLVDASMSMAGEPITTVIDGARNFIEAMASLDEAGIIVYSDRVLATTGLAAQQTLLLDAVENVDAQGGSAVYDILLVALRAVMTRQGRRVVVLLSDGHDMHSSLSMDQVRQTARRSQAQIYWIRPAHAPADPLTNPDLVDIESWRWFMERPHKSFDSWRPLQVRKQQHLQLLAAVEESGGKVVTIEQTSDVGAAMTEILRELREQYAIGFYPGERNNDGSWRTVEVTTHVPDIQLRTCEGYLDY